MSFDTVEADVDAGASMAIHWLPSDAECGLGPKYKTYNCTAHIQSELLVNFGEFYGELLKSSPIHI